MKKPLPDPIEKDRFKPISMVWHACCFALTTNWFCSVKGEKNEPSQYVHAGLRRRGWDRHGSVSAGAG
ncbi:MAG: hypothetical protein E5V70_11835 [Mesorhizobium sp.]|nr:MAG: hypothetical protein E5V70_11835 [Mesorhizobium sp.]